VDEIVVFAAGDPDLQLERFVVRMPKNDRVLPDREAVVEDGAHSHLFPVDDDGGPGDGADAQGP